jgi:hypothetical protein
MKVRVKSIDRVGELVDTKYISLPKLDIKNGNLVQVNQPPQFLMMIAFKDQFGVVPIQDLTPLFDDSIEVDSVGDIVDKEQQQEAATEKESEVVSIETDEGVVDIEVTPDA